jgi:hypothetical protein
MHLRILSVAATALFFSLTGFTQTVKLNLTPGTKYEVSTVMKITSLASVMGQTMESNINNESIENYNVKSVASNNNELSASLKKVKLSITAMGQDMDYDSENQNNSGPLNDAFKDKVGKEYTVLYDDNGKVLNPDVVISAKPEAIVPGMNPPGDDVSLLNADFLNRQITNGASWYDSVTTKTGKMTSTTKGTYKVLSVQGDMATILFEGKTEQAGVVEQMGMEMNMSGGGNLTKEIMLDMKTGLVVQMNSRTTGTNKIETMGMDIPVEINATTTTKIKQLRD